MKLLDVLQTIEWAEKHFSCCLTNRQLPRRDVLKAVEKGFVKSFGMAVVCDGDGYSIEPERYRGPECDVYHKEHLDGCPFIKARAVLEGK